MMKSLVIAFALLCAGSANAQQHDWENPHVFGINKLPYHATLQLPSRETECEEIVSLDGQWQFHWSKDPDSRIMDFWQTDYDVTGWDKIAVPGNWRQSSMSQSICTRAAIGLLWRCTDGATAVTWRIRTCGDCQKKHFVCPLFGTPNAGGQDEA